MASHQLVNAPRTPGARRKPARRVTFAFAVGGVNPASSDGEASVWIVDGNGILILPADQGRGGPSSLANRSPEAPD